MKKILLTILFLCATASYAQIIFEKGYFIDNAGQRTECYIKNLDWRNNPVGFIYKEQVDSEHTKMAEIASVSEFGIDNISKYKRFAVNIERSQADLNNLQKSKNPIWKKETLFLNLLVSGDANLYLYTDENLTKYFYETPAVQIEQLVRIKYLSNDPANRGFNESVKENNQFRQQLFNNVKCAKSSEQDIRQIRYEKNDLIKHFTTYNSCGTNEVVNYDEKNKRKSYALRLHAGIYQASLSITDPATFYNVGTDVDKTIVKFGIELEYILPFNKSTWSIFASPAYQQFNVDKTYIKNDGFSNASRDIHHKAVIEYTSIEVPVGFRRYFYLNDSSKIFADLAYVFDTTLSTARADFTNEENLFNATKTVNINSRNNLALGLGFSYKKYSAELKWNLQRQIFSDYLAWDGKYSTIGITLGYNFL